MRRLKYGLELKKRAIGAKSTHKKCAFEGNGCPAEAPYGCFLPDLTRFGTYRHPNPSNAQVQICIVARLRAGVYGKKCLSLFSHDVGDALAGVKQHAARARHHHTLEELAALRVEVGAILQ